MGIQPGPHGRPTQRQLRQGERLTELLKQGQYVPMEVTKQVIIIFAAVAGEGFIDHLPISALGRYERELFSWLETQKADVLKLVAENVDKTPLKEEDDPVRQALVAALTEFKALFQA